IHGGGWRGVRHRALSGSRPGTDGRVCRGRHLWPGYGSYLSVDWALVADVLPSDATFARDMGVWNIGLTIPQVLAAVFGGWMLALGVILGSTSLGYTFLFVSFV